jgi:ferredoxin
MTTETVMVVTAWNWILLEEPGCIGCGVCADICPSEALMMTREMSYPSAVPGKCTGCEDCIDECPVDTIEIIPAG